MDIFSWKVRKVFYSINNAYSESLVYISTHDEESKIIMTNSRKKQ